MSITPLKMPQQGLFTAGGALSSAGRKYLEGIQTITDKLKGKALIPESQEPFLSEVSKAESVDNAATTSLRIDSASGTPPSGYDFASSGSHFWDNIDTATAETKTKFNALSEQVEAQTVAINRIIAALKAAKLME